MLIWEPRLLGSLHPNVNKNEAVDLEGVILRNLLLLAEDVSILKH
jgi:hypothetical protein